MLGEIKLHTSLTVSAILIVATFMGYAEALKDKDDVFSIGVDAEPSFKRPRRQVDTELVRSCNELQQFAMCGSSYAQSYVNVLRLCGDQALDDIRTVEHGCRVNENFQFCSEVVTASLEQDVRSKCGSGCMEACRAALNSVTSKIGCCASFYFETEFSRCSIPRPSQCSQSDIEISSISDDGFCTTERRLRERKFNFSCTNRYPITNFLRSRGCYGTARKYDLKCLVQNGGYCVDKVDTFSSEAMPLAQSSLRTAASNCDVESSNCSSQCNSSLMDLSEELGCCVRSLNVSRDLFPHLDTSFFKYSLWEKCDVPVPCISVSGVAVARRSFALEVASALVTVAIVKFVA